MQIKQSTAFKIPIVLQDASGNPLTGVAFGSVTVYLQKQGGSSTAKTLSAPDWTEIDSTNFPGVYDLNLSTTDTNTVGWLKVSAKTSTSTLALAVPEIVANVVSDVISVVNTIQASLVAASLTAATGSTSSQVRTAAAQADNFYNGMVLMIVNAAGVAARIIETYANTNGAFNLSSALPFTPTNGDAVYILGDNPAGVWDVTRSDHATSGTFGQGAASVQGNVTGSVGSVTGAVGSVTGDLGGNVDGHVVGSVGSVASAGITSASLAASALTAIQGEILSDATPFKGADIATTKAVLMATAL